MNSLHYVPFTFVNVQPYQDMAKQESALKSIVAALPKAVPLDNIYAIAN